MINSKKVLLLLVCFLVSKSAFAKTALIFGVTGQDGAYLSDFLLEKGYEVHGVRRRSSSHNTSRIDPLIQNKRFFLHYGDIVDPLSVLSVIKTICPDEIYNLAAQSDVRLSFDVPLYTAQVNAIGTLNILEAIRMLGLVDQTRVYQASTSELFGLVQEVPQSELTTFYPRSPYAVAKLYAYWICVNYREAHNLFICNGILFNHESPLRGENFVTRKITLAACRCKLGLQDTLYLGNLDAKRDWGYAKEYVEVMWLMLQQACPDDYVIATGEEHSVREFVELAYKELGIEIKWQDRGVHECGIDCDTGKVIVQVDPEFYRPSEVDQLLGNVRKAQEVLNWKPKTTFQELVKFMIEADYKLCLEEKNQKRKN